jgi:vanillate O-demethylase monooxygenase subunit
MKTQEPNYPNNCWWVAAASREVGRRPLGRWLLDQPVVLYRKEDGQVVALEDRCAHRWAPLSAGKIVGDSLVCGYHGFRYGSSGLCEAIPSQRNVPKAAKVKAYPVVERKPFVWIWMGDPSRAREIPVPDLEFVTGDEWVRASDYLYLEANYFLLQENVLDLTHFAFVHADTLQIEGWEQGETQVFFDEQTVRFSRTTKGLPLAPLLTIPTGIPPGTIADSTTFGELLLPGVHSAGIDIEAPFRGGNSGKDYNFRIAHLTTPESPTTTHYWWVIGQNYGISGSKEMEMLHGGIVVAFDQDKTVLESIQKVVVRDPRHAEAPEVSVVADRPAIHARKILKAMLERD